MPKTAGKAVREAAPETVPEAARVTVPETRPAVEEWLPLLERLDLKGMARELALNCAPREVADEAMVLTVDPAHAHLLNEARGEQIEQALTRHYGRPVRLKILKEGALTGDTPARRQAREREARKREAIQSIEADENIKALQDAFGATVNYDSIRPRD
jgi:DNA polymerase-3 subunit gamma/tau